MRFRFSIRDLLWLTLAAAIVIELVRFFSQTPVLEFVSHG